MCSEGPHVKQRCQQAIVIARCVLARLISDASRGVDDALAASREGVFAASCVHSKADRAGLVGDRVAAAEAEEEEAAAEEATKSAKRSRDPSLGLDL